MSHFLKKNFQTLILSGLVLFLLHACSNSKKDEKTIYLAHAMHLQHPVAIAMDSMATLVEEKSDGKLNVKIYPSQQLGSERKLLELVQIGTIGMTKVSAAALENTVPAFRVFSLPYLFRDDEHVYQVQDGKVGQAILDEGIPYHLKGVAYYDAGSRSFYTTNKPIRKPADLQGMKIRVMESVMAIRLMRELGGSPTPISYGELYTAFQGGIVDGAENNPPSFHTSRHYEVTDYYSLNEHTSIPDVLVVGTKLWNELNSQQKEWLKAAINESVEYQRKLWKESEREALEIVQEAGVEVIYPDKRPFREKLEPLYEEIKQNQPELYEWVEKIRDVTEPDSNATKN